MEDPAHVHDPSDHEVNELVAQLASPDRNTSDFALQTLLQLFQNFCLRIAMSILHNAEDAEEVVDDVFIKIFQRADQFDPAIASFKSWIASIVKHACIDRIRPTLGRHMETLADQDETHPAMRVDPSVLEDMIERETLENVMRCLDDLPPLYRTIMIMRFVDGMTQQKIADELNMSVGNVNYHLQNAISALQRLLKKGGVHVRRER